MLCAGVSLFAAGPLGGEASAQTVRRGEPSVALRALTGRDSFDGYCASCHGTSAKGDGPLAASLKTTPSDLTALSRRNGGAYPRAQVLAAIDGTGRALPSHGATEMPLWGGIFRWLDSEGRTRVRMDNLVAYVESLQGSGDATGVPEPRLLSGGELFQTFCASCHGPNGKGGGVMSGQLRRDPPNLTRLKGLSAERLRRIIDGREIAAHGDRTMPVWGDVFLRRENDRGAGNARVAALVGYLLSIQERPAE
jgi:mono/diheme cytochrome c family protein